MGVVKRQGIKQSIVNYIGVAIGAISVIFIYSQDTETYGFARFLIDTAALITPLILFGASSVSIKFFPDFKNPKNHHNGLLGFLLIILALGSVLVFALLYFNFTKVLAIYADRPTHYLEQVYKIGILGLAMAFLTLLISYVSNFQRIVVPAIFQAFPKFTLPVLILLFVWKKISLNFLANGILITYLAALIGMLFYCIWLGEFSLKLNLNFISRPLFKRIRSYALFSVFSGLGVMMAFRIDSFMVSTLLDFKSNGAYNIAAFIGNAIAIPGIALASIASPLVSKAFKENDMGQIRFLYQQASVNLLIFGLLLFILVVASIEDLFLLMPIRDFDISDGLIIVFILGASRVLEMGTSINSQIINYSKYYRFNLVSIIILAILNICLNLVLIPRYSIIGAALATLISIALFNLMKLIFIYLKFKIQPFSKETLIAILFAGIAFSTNWIAPDFSLPLLNIIVKSVLIILVYGVLVLYFKVSEDINGLYHSLIKRILNFISI